MSTAAETTRVSIAVEINGAPHFVNLPLDRMMILIKMASSLSDTGSLPVVRATAGYQFQELGAL